MWGARPIAVLGVAVGVVGIAAAAPGDPTAGQSRATASVAQVTVPGGTSGGSGEITAPPQATGGGSFAFPPDGSVLHVPVTYRAAPVAGADEHLIGTMEHSVLGRRWAYDGCADPVFAHRRQWAGGRPQG